MQLIQYRKFCINVRLKGIQTLRKPRKGTQSVGFWEYPKLQSAEVIVLVRVDFLAVLIPNINSFQLPLSAESFFRLTLY